MNDKGELQAAGRLSGLMKQAARMGGSLLAVALTWVGLSGAGAQSLSGQAGRSSAAADGSPRREMISLVVLSNSCVDLDVRSLSKALDEIYPGKFVPLEQQANFVVSGRRPGQFLVKSTIPGAAGMFMVLSVPGPYTEFSEFARFIRTRRCAAKRRHSNVGCRSTLSICSRTKRKPIDSLRLRLPSSRPRIQQSWSNRKQTLQSSSPRSCAANWRPDNRHRRLVDQAWASPCEPIELRHCMNGFRAAQDSLHLMRLIPGARDQNYRLMPRVQSSVMTYVHYDEDPAELDVTFASGKIYRYAGVPLATYVGLLEADSKGEFFNENIKDVFPYVEVKRRGKS